MYEDRTGSERGEDWPEADYEPLLGCKEMLRPGPKNEPGERVQDTFRPWDRGRIYSAGPVNVVSNKFAAPFPCGYWVLCNRGTKVEWVVGDPLNPVRSQALIFLGTHVNAMMLTRPTYLQWEGVHFDAIHDITLALRSGGWHLPMAGAPAAAPAPLAAAAPDAVPPPTTLTVPRQLPRAHGRTHSARLRCLTVALEWPSSLHCKRTSIAERSRASSARMHHRW